MKNIVSEIIFAFEVVASEKVVVRAFMQCVRIVVYFCLIGTSLICKAQSGWTEDDCIRYAVNHNLGIRNKQLDIKMAAVDEMTAIADFLPSVKANSASGRQWGHSINPVTNQYTSKSFLESTIGLNISLPIFEGFSRLNKLQFYKLNKKINLLMVETEKNRLAFEILEAFYRYCFDREICRLVAEQRKLSEDYYNQMEEYVGLGMRSRSDLQEMKARLQSDIYQEMVRINSCHHSLLELKEMMNMKESDTLPVITPDIPTDAVGSSPDLEELYAASVSVVPEYRIMAMKEQSAGKQYAIAKGSLYPSIRMDFNLTTGYYDTERNKYGEIASLREQLRHNMNKYIGISVSLPLFNGMSRWGSVKKEKLHQQQIRNENEQQRLTLYKELSDTYFSYKAAWQECVLAKEQLHADSLTWKESEEKWREGMVSTFECVEKRNRFIQAKAEIVRTTLQYNLKKRLMQFYQYGTFLYDSKKEGEE